MEEPCLGLRGIVADVGDDLALGDLHERTTVAEREQVPGVDDADELVASHRRDVVPGQDAATPGLAYWDDVPAPVRSSQPPRLDSASRSALTGSGTVIGRIGALLDEHHPVEPVQGHPERTVDGPVGSSPSLSLRPDGADDALRIRALVDGDDAVLVLPSDAEPAVPQLHALRVGRGRLAARWRGRTRRGRWAR